MANKTYADQFGIGREAIDNGDGTYRDADFGENLATAQVTVAATATLIAAARAGRSSIVVTNMGATAVYLGGSGVTTSTGDLLQGVAGTVKIYDGGAAVYGIAATGTQVVSVAESY